MILEDLKSVKNIIGKIALKVIFEISKIPTNGILKHQENIQIHLDFSKTSLGFSKDSEI